MSVAQAWDRWREECCAEIGGHWWNTITGPAGTVNLTFACARCPVTVEAAPVDGLITAPWGELFPIVEGTCEHCGTPFRRAATSASTGDFPRYCCPEHADRARERRRKRRRSAAKQRKQARRAELDAAYRLAEPRLRAEAKGRARREVPVQSPCPHPEKLAFTTQGDALAKAVRDARKFSRPYRAYPCDPEHPDGHWHITSRYARTEFIPFSTARRTSTRR